MSIFKSRKFWIMVADVSVSTATYLVTSFVNPALADKIIWLIGAWQPVIVMVVAGIAIEDAAKTE
jgi:hypothetical protein